MEVDRADGRTPNQRRPVACTRGILHRAHGSASWAQGTSSILFYYSSSPPIQFHFLDPLSLLSNDAFSLASGDTKVIAAVYGPKAGTRKNENPEKACIEVIWKPKTGQSGE